MRKRLNDFHRGETIKWRRIGDFVGLTGSGENNEMRGEKLGVV